MRRQKFFPVLGSAGIAWRSRVEIFQFNHISNGARTTPLTKFKLISRAELSNGDVEASSAYPERSPAAIRVEVGSDISDGEWLCCVRQ